MSLTVKPKPPAHHKKLSGKHHRPTKGYLKTYWPYIPLAAIVSVGLLVNSLLTGTGSVLGASSDFTAGGLLAATNQSRLDDRETPLSLNPQLAAAAQAKANDMVRRNYWSHNTPDGQTPWSFILRSGYSYDRAGENLAYGFADGQAVQQAWLHSPEHRANVLNPAFQAVGFGFASSPDYVTHGAAVVVVAMYASPAGSAAPAAPPQSPPLKPVARLQLLTGDAQWSIYGLALIGGLSCLLFLWRHARAWQRLLLRGEDFMLEHGWLDVLVVSLAVASYLLLQAAGTIG